MRIHLKLTKNSEPVPFTYQEQMTDLIHNWTKEYAYPSKVSLHSFSNLRRGKKVADALSFENGSSFFISSWNNDFLHEIIKSVQENSSFCFGMRVSEIIIQETPDLTNIDFFRLASPVLICRTVANKKEYYYHNDDNAGTLLTETIRTKMKAAGLTPDESLSIAFDVSFHNGHKKRISYKGVSNPVSVRPVIIKGENETKQFIWNVGLGNSTGIGFGAIS
jgi:CRISPR-associated endoribonuclease Cas6